VSNRIISAERASFPVSVMCEVLGVSRPGFHQWERRAPSDRALNDAWLIEKITDIHELARGVYGSRRVQAELRLSARASMSPAGESSGLCGRPGSPDW
jgi:putative transposase